MDFNQWAKPGTAAGVFATWARVWLLKCLLRTRVLLTRFICGGITHIQISSPNSLVCEWVKLVPCSEWSWEAARNRVLEGSHSSKGTFRSSLQLVWTLNCKENKYGNRETMSVCGCLWPLDVLIYCVQFIRFSCPRNVVTSLPLLKSLT